MNNSTTPTHKTRVAIVFGGKSAEHEISVQSASNVVAALDRTQFELTLVGIDTQGGWHAVEKPDDLSKATSHTTQPDLALLEDIDVVFPILHGPMGEDGTMQGLFELMELPYVGPNVLSSAVGMDKDVMKRLLRDADILVAPFMTVTASERPYFTPESAVETLGLPLFVKPANMGSSIGVSRVADVHELMVAIDNALRFDTKVLLETAIVGDEIECAVLGNEHPESSVIGRIVPDGSFYSYDAKYDSGHTTGLEIPAKLPTVQAEHARQTALQVYQLLGCEGLSRVDMFALSNGDIVVNEINTLPGFTTISMYPKLWEASGVSYTELITRLLELALERAQKRSNLQTTH
jgi:D-alanine-D-alanine ligase